MKRLVRVALLLGTVVFAGCATVQPDARFPEVRRMVEERVGGEVAWNVNGSSDAVRTRVETLLAQPLTADSSVQIALLNSNALQAIFEDLGGSLRRTSCKQG